MAVSLMAPFVGTFIECCEMVTEIAAILERRSADPNHSS